MSTEGSGPGWYPDPYGRHEVRYFDGSQWSEHVSSHGRQSADPPGGQSTVPTVGRTTDKVQRDVAKVGAQFDAAGGGTLFSEPILVVNQKAKLIEVNSEFAIFDKGGRQIGAVRQVGQSTAKKVMRVLTSYDQFMTHKFQSRRHDGDAGPGSHPTGQVREVQDHRPGRLGQRDRPDRPGERHRQDPLRLHAGGRRIGSLNAENWRAWNFNIADEGGTEVARMTKTWEGLAKTMFTTADNYVVQIHRPLDEPLRSLVLASALGVDTALKQDARGFG